jgi:hypothetical protein
MHIYLTSITLGQTSHSRANIRWWDTTTSVPFTYPSRASACITFCVSWLLAGMAFSLIQALYHGLLDDLPYFHKYRAMEYSCSLLFVA